MANFHKVTNWVAMDPLVILKAKNSFLPYWNTDYNKELNKDYPIGEGFDIKFPFRFITRTGQRRQERDVVRRSTRVEMGDPIGIDFAWNDFEAAMQMDRDEASMRKQFTAPAAAALSTALGMRMAYEAYMRCPHIVGVLGTDPTSVATYSKSQRVMKEIEAEDDDHGLFITPAMADNFRQNMTLLPNPVRDTSNMFRDGYIQRIYGADVYDTVLLRQHTTGIVTTAASLTCSGNVAQGATTVTINCTSGDTFKAGDRVSFASSFWVHPDTRQKFGTALANQAVYIVQQDVTATTTTCTLTLDRAIYGSGSADQNVDALPLNNALMTRWPGTAIADGGSVTGTVGFRLHRNALALVGAKLRNPKAVEFAAQSQDPDTNLSISVVSQYDNDSRKTGTRMDLWAGYGSLYTANAAVCVLGA